MTPNRYSLLADIGGTNTRVALAEGARLLPQSIRRFANADFATFDAVLAAYLAIEEGVDCAGACVAVAGPVREGTAHLTNLDWTITADSLARATRAEVVAILNDLQAQGHALGHLAPGAQRPVMAARGPAAAMATQLVIGVGTGFNAAPVHETGAGRIVLPSECGHASLPVRSAEDLRLLQFVETAHGFPGVEDVLSGRGLERLHAFVQRDHGGLAEASAPAIMAGLAAGEPQAVETGRIFVRLLGMVAGNLALIHLPYGGIGLCGGVARAFAPWLGPFGFADAFRDKGRFSDFMQDFPVFMIEDDFAALTGCAHYMQGRMG
ncbi:glucokinase [Candidatus Falkowbacteria bacterium]|nr:glucokinase [Candidatus Falkowbacteria bacterium]